MGHMQGGQVKLKGQDVGGGSGWRLGLGGKNRLWGEMSRQFALLDMKAVIGKRNRTF